MKTIKVPQTLARESTRFFGSCFTRRKQATARNTPALRAHATQTYACSTEYIPGGHFLREHNIVTYKETI